MLFQKIHQIKMLYPDMKTFLLNTDACVISLPNNATLNNISEKTGDFKHQINQCKEILTFYGLSPVCYHLTYKNNEDTIMQISKLAGFKLNTVLTGTLDTHQFEYLLSLAMLDEKNEFPIQQLRTFKKFDSQVTKKIVFHLRNIVDRTRVIQRENFTTLPYGFKH